MDIKEISSILSSSFYKVNNTQNVGQTSDSTEESSTSSSVGTSSDSYENTILNSMDAIASGTYNKMLQEVVNGGIDFNSVLEAASTAATSTAATSTAATSTATTSTAATSTDTSSTTAASGSGTGSDTTKSEVTTELVVGSDGSIYLKTTTTTADGETSVQTQKIAEGSLDSQNNVKFNGCDKWSNGYR